jgi:hypothetical protein
MPAPSPETRKDRDEVAQIKAMLADHDARNCVECVQIGEHIHRHLARKALPRGAVQRYAKQHFNHDAEYVRRFIRLLVYQDELPEAQAWEVATGWHNPYTTEPQRSNNLLTKFWKSRRDEGSAADPVRNSVTADAQIVTESHRSIGGYDSKTTVEIQGAGQLCQPTSTESKAASNTRILLACCSASRRCREITNRKAEFIASANELHRLLQFLRWAEGDLSAGRDLD